MKRAFVVAVLPIACISIAPAVQAQQDPNADMQVIAASLGVRCDYCHVRMGAGRPQGGPGQEPIPEPKRDFARQMMAMTRDLNTKIREITGKPANEAAQIRCVTCHRGVPIPKQLTEIMLKTALEKDGDAAVAQYRDLREHYYGRQAYDFGEDTLFTTGQTLASIKPDAAIALLQLNLEYYPKSTRTYSALAFAYTRKLDDADAIAILQKALEIEPENGIIKGQLAQLQSYQRRRQ